MKRVLKYSIAAAMLFASVAIIANWNWLGPCLVRGNLFVNGGVLTFGSASTATAGLAMGSGTSASPTSTSTVDTSYGLFYTKTTATSGTSRGLYWKHFFADTTPSGETARLFSEVDTAGATDVHGAHISISYGTNGTCTGESAALRTTFMVPNKTLGGTNGSNYTEVWADGSSSNWSNGQFQRYVFGGDGTGVTALDLTTALFSIEGGTIGSAGQGHTVDAISGDKAVTHLIKVRINGATYWLMARNAE